MNWTKLWQRLYRVQAHCVFEAECASVAAPAWPAGETVVRFNAARPLPSDLHRRLLSLRRDDGPYISDAHRGKAEGLVVLVDGKVVHSAYLMFRNKTTCLLGFDRAVGLLGNSFTVEHYRGRGCQARSTHERVAMARRAGLASVISETHPDNLASQRGLAKGGMSLVGTVRFTVLLNALVIRHERPRSSVRAIDLCL